MILLDRSDHQSDPKRRQIIALFGVGLIGRSILAAIGRAGPFKVCDLPFTWDVEGGQAQELEVIQRYIFAARNEDAICPVSRIDIVWAAGRSGFGSSEDQIIPEVRALEKVLSLSLQLLDSAANARHSFHLLSSAGGLFEGQKNVDRTSLPRPLRAYGRAKLQQEELLSRMPSRIRKMIYRPSSVYGSSSNGYRLGLISALIQNSIRHKTSNIFGDSHTIRDYVLAADVGQFVANRLLDVNAECRIYTLASGKPTTVLEILHRIERILGRKVFFTFDKVRTNASDIGFSRSVLPKFWCPTDLETGLRQTVRRLTTSTLTLN